SVEIRRHVLHERGWNDRLDIDQSQFAAARLREFQRLFEPFRSRGRIGEIDRENDALIHSSPPLGRDAQLEALPTPQRDLLLTVWQAARRRALFGLRPRRPGERTLIDDSHCSLADGSL